MSEEAKIIISQLDRIAKVLETLSQAYSQSVAVKTEGKEITEERKQDSVEAKSGSVGQGGFAMQVGEEIIAPFANAFRDGFKKMFSDMANDLQQTVKATFEPREKLREIASYYAEAGTSLNEEQLSGLYDQLETQAKTKREAIFRANKVMPNAGTSFFEGILESYAPNVGPFSGVQQERQEMYTARQLWEKKNYDQVYDNFRKSSGD